MKKHENALLKDLNCYQEWVSCDKQRAAEAMVNVVRCWPAMVTEENDSRVLALPDAVLLDAFSDRLSFEMPCRKGHTEMVCNQYVCACE